MTPMSYHPFAARPALPKRHTSPSPSALLSLPTLEDLPPTPKSAKSYDLLPGPFLKTASSSHYSQKSLSRSTTGSTGKMPLIKSRSSKSRKSPIPPTNDQGSVASRSGSSSFFPFDVPSIVSNAFDLRGKHHRVTSHSQPPLSSPPTISRDFAPVQSYSPFSASTPPSASYSKGSLSAMPSIQGVMNSYEGRDEESNRSLTSKRGKWEKRETMNLPMMLLSSATEPYQGRRDGEEEWINDVHPSSGEFSHGASGYEESTSHEQFQSQSTSFPANLPSSRIQHTRPRNVTLTIETAHLGRRSPSSSRELSGSSATRSRESQQTPLGERTPPDDRRLSNWFGPEHEDLDDVELGALDVLEHTSGQLMRDGYGYGTGPSPGLDLPSNARSNTHNRLSPHEHGSEGAHDEAQRYIPGISRSTSASASPSGGGNRSSSSLPKDGVRPGSTDPYDNQPYPQQANSGGEGRGQDQIGLKSWRESRKRTKSHGFGLNLMAVGRGDNQHHHQHQTHHHSHSHWQGWGSVSIPAHRPPPPPPQMELPPLPTESSISSSAYAHAHMNNRAPSDCIDKVQTSYSSYAYRHPDNEAPCENNRASLPTAASQRAPPIPPRSASRAEGDKTLRRKLSKPGLSQSPRPRPETPSIDSATIAVDSGRRNSKDKQGVRVPLVLATAEHDDVVIIEKIPPTPTNAMTTSPEPIHRQPLPPLPTQATTVHRSDSIPHPKFAARILRPKRPSTAPGPAKGKSGSSTPTPRPTPSTISPDTPMSPLDPNSVPAKAAPVKLIPRTEPRPLSSDASGRTSKEGMSALSFLALDEVAAKSGVGAGRTQPFQHRSASFGSLSTSTHAHTRTQSHSQPARAESPDGLEGGYIMPPSERSKIGVDDRKERRRRRRGSRSSLSSVAGSQSSGEEDGGDTAGARNDVGGRGDGVDDEWSTAREFNEAKEKKKQHELRLSLQLASQPQDDDERTKSPFPNSLSPPPRPNVRVKPKAKSRPAPLNSDLLARSDARPIPVPKSASLLPPPRPRRKTVPSAPPAVRIPIDIPPVPTGGEDGVAPSPTSTYRQISPKYTHRPNLDPTTPKGHDGMRDFMDLASPSPSLSAATANSPGLETPGTYVFPSTSKSTARGFPSPGVELSSNETSKLAAYPDADTEVDNIPHARPVTPVQRVGERKASSSTTHSDRERDRSSAKDSPTDEDDLVGPSGPSVREDGSSTWSSESENQRERERRMITSLWLSSKPTKAAEYNQRAADGGQGNLHPFYEGSRNGSTKGRKGGVVVDGGYGRGSLGVRV